MQFADDEAASRITLDGGVVLTRCDQCRQMYAERTPPGPPNCDELCPVEARVLREENEDAARIYNIVRGQVLTRWNGERDVIVGLNQLAVWAAIDAYGVRDRTGCFEKVRRLFFDRLKQDGGK